MRQYLNYAFNTIDILKSTFKIKLYACVRVCGWHGVGGVWGVGVWVGCVGVGMSGWAGGRV
jgi:hypothetical protein